MYETIVNQLEQFFECSYLPYNNLLSLTINVTVEIKSLIRNFNA